jgi:site-specific recombinase XerD
MSAPALASPALAPVVQRFFAERLVQQRHVTAATIAAYRDTFRLLLRFAEGHRKTAPALMRLDDLDAPLVLAFLDHLEQVRGNTIRSRNARLAAVRSFIRYASTEEPTSLSTAQRVLAIPTKRHAKPMLGFLSREDMQAILDAPPAEAWTGQRDRALFLTLYNTGARISEALGHTIGDVLLDGTPRVVLRGKGRKERMVPLWTRTARLLAAWIRTLGGGPTERLFPNGRHGPLTRSGAAQRLPNPQPVRQHGERRPPRLEARVQLQAAIPRSLLLVLGSLAVSLVLVLVSAKPTAGQNPPSSGTWCGLLLSGETRNRHVYGAVNAECGSCVGHTAPFGNWGVYSYFCSSWDGDQYKGWKEQYSVCNEDMDDPEWNSCTGDFQPPSSTYYNHPSGV